VFFCYSARPAQGAGGAPRPRHPPRKGRLQTMGCEKTRRGGTRGLLGNSAPPTFVPPGHPGRPSGHDAKRERRICLLERLQVLASFSAIGWVVELGFWVGGGPIQLLILWPRHVFVLGAVKGALLVRWICLGPGVGQASPCDHPLRGGNRPGGYEICPAGRSGAKLGDGGLQRRSVPSVCRGKSPSIHIGPSVGPGFVKVILGCRS